MKNLLLLLASVLLALALAEACVRLLERVGLLAGETSLVFAEGAHAGKPVPSANPILVFEPDPDDASLNADGFRDRDFPLARGTSQRIAVLGDSVTFGRGVPLEQSYTKVLERLLNAERPVNAQVEVMNLGVGGYNTRQELEFYERRGRKYQPDLLVVGYVHNDCHPPSLLIKHFARSKRQRESRSLPTRIAGSSRVWERLRDLTAGPAGSRPGAPLWIRDQCLKPDNWRIVSEGFARLAEIAANDRVPVLIVIFPLMFDLDDDPFAILHTRVTDLARRHGFWLLDLLPDFERYAVEDLQAIPGDVVHPNAEGHRIAGERIHAYLAENPILAGGNATPTPR